MPSLEHLLLNLRRALSTFSFSPTLMVDIFFTRLCPKLFSYFAIITPYKIAVKSFSTVFRLFLKFLHYSVRSAITGSFFAALFAGIKPLIKVSATLIATIISADVNGRAANFAIPVSGPKIALMPSERR